MKSAPGLSDLGVLGLEAGGTRTTARYETLSGAPVIEREFGPANLRLLTDAQLQRHLRAIARAMPAPAVVAIGMAGARTEADRQRVREQAGRAWPGVPCVATNDLETALMAAENRATQGAGTGVPYRVLVLSGTGSCCFGRAPAGETAKVGGWGHILGDKGSAYEIGLRALKAVVYYGDRDGRWPKLGQRLLSALMLNEPDELIDWVRQADKDEIARLALEVFVAWRQGDRIASDILAGAAHSLARDAVACARRLRPRGGLVEFILAGGVLLRQPRFGRRVAQAIKRDWANARVIPLRRSGVEGAVALARARHAELTAQTNAFRARRSAAPQAQPALRTATSSPAEPSARSPILSRELSVTEQRNPRSLKLDQLSPRAAVDLMLGEEAAVSRALRRERQRLARGVDLIVRSFRRGGRLFYVGAGTSGRLGVLDASECPPTFQSPPEQVQGIIAGGRTALWSAVEGAEDDEAAGARALQFRGVTRRDTVVGLAASGRTPFVWGALDHARSVGASTILVCFNPSLIIPRERRPDLVIAPSVGPEVLTGSTRLKSGTATKLILNLFTTLAMVRLGKVRSNLMVDVKASNSKLRDRAVRITQTLTGADPETVRAALVRHGWQIVRAEQALRRAARG